MTPPKVLKFVDKVYKKKHESSDYFSPARFHQYSKKLVDLIRLVRELNKIIYRISENQGRTTTELLTQSRKKYFVTMGKNSFLCAQSIASLLKFFRSRRL